MQELPDSVERYEFGDRGMSLRASERGGYFKVADLPAIIAQEREKWEGEIRRASDELESDPAADPGTYVHDVECAILRSRRST